MRCVMCPRTSNMTRSQGFMDFELFKKAIDELVAVNQSFIDDQPVWLHHFGESLLHPNCMECIDYAVQKGIRACLSINPIVLKEELGKALVESGLFLLYLSLDGHDEDSFFKIRGLKNAYQSSIDKILRFLELKRASKCTTKITISMIDFEMNAESISQTRSYWESVAGVDQFLLKSFSTWDGSAQDINRYQSGFSCGSEKIECTLPWERMTILWDGRVVPCCNDYDGKYVLGDLSNDTLAVIWNGHPMQTLRQEFNSNRVTNLLCRKCDKLRTPRHLMNW